MRIALAACLALLLTAAAHAAAHAAPAAKRLFPELSAADEKAAVFVLGNVLFTLYHEIGHALVHAFDIPVLGREEDAVDGLAAVLMIPETPDPLMDALVIAAADGWALTARRADGRKLSYWDEHSLDEQRFYSTACLIVGSDPEGFYRYALKVGLPEARIDTCPGYFAQIRRAWRQLLRPHRPADGVTAKGRFRMRYEEPPAALRGVRTFLRSTRIAETGAAAIEKLVALPADVDVAFRSCGRANAYYDPATRTVLLCYELVREFEALIAGGTADR